MDTADAVAIYGAGLSTAIALTQGVSAWRRSTKVSVSAEMAYSTGNSPYGTPIAVQRGNDVVEETATINFTIRNLGGNPVQVLGLLLETLVKSSQTLQTREVTPSGLPIVLEPGTTIQADLQKEHLDLLESCTFIGVVDGSGRRHRVNPERAAALLRECWRLPTRVDVYHRRDDPEDRVVAFSLGDSAKLTSRPATRPFRGRPSVLAERSRPLIEALMNDEQPRVRALGRRDGNGEA